MKDVIVEIVVRKNLGNATVRQAIQERERLETDVRHALGLQVDTDQTEIESSYSYEPEFEPDGESE